MKAQVTKGAEAGSARERLLKAANELFYEEGVHTVGIDRVIEKAGVAKASLYSTFGSKDALVEAYLAGRHESRKARVMKKIAAATTPRARLLAAFDALEERVSEPSWRGCAFVLATAEGRPSSGLRRVADESRAWMRALLVELAVDAGAADPKRLAQQLILIYDGATVGSHMDDDTSVVKAARGLAATLVDASLGKRDR
jgi:AcrR family transcriptional regulator